MLNGFKILICGTSKITETHIKVIKNFKDCNIRYLFGSNNLRKDYLSKKFKIKICDNLNDQNLKECNLAIITNSVKDHFSTVELLSDKISNFIIEKSIVKNTLEFEKLKKLQNIHNLNIQEVSQYIYAPFIKENKNNRKNLKIIINKKRNLNYYKDYKGKIEFYKNPITSQMPHWLDVAGYLTSSNLKILKIEKKKSDINMPFNDIFKIILEDNSRLQILIDLNFACKINKTTEIIISDKLYKFGDTNISRKFKTYLNLLIPFINLNNFQEECFQSMYRVYLNNILENTKINFQKYLNKFSLLDELNKHV